MMTPASTDTTLQGTLPSDELSALLDAMAQGTPWRSALRDLALPTLSAKPDWFTNEAKAAFYLSLPTPSNALAVDVGAGSGVIAGALTSKFERVIALERNARWCEFMERRFAADGVPAEVIPGTAMAIPETAKQADLVVVNGVLEWVASGDDPAVAEQRPAAVQLAFLRGILDALRPGGQIGIAIENRYFYENFRGASPHGEPPYAAVVPRWAADRMTRRRRGEPYRTWIYGAAGYRRLLRAAGFSNVQVRAAVPSYHRPTDVMPLSDSAGIRARIGPRAGAKARALDVLSRVGALGYFVHSFYISAQHP